jgi:uncharacterized metal-binding protein
VGCAKATLAINGIEAENHVVITDLGIEKNKDLTVTPQDVETVKSATRKGMMDTGMAVNIK